MPHPEIPLVAALIPAFIGVCAWRRRGNPGATTLAYLMWSLSAWSALHALELAPRWGQADQTLQLAEQMVLLAVAPLWFVFTLRHTGRERQLTRLRMALLASVPLVTLALILSGYAPLRSLDALAGQGDLTGAALLWLWVDLAYRATLVLAGTAFLVLTVLGSRKLYALQSLFLLAGMLPPWAAVAIHQLGSLDDTLDDFILPGALAASGLALAWALFRHRLLDLSPMARDTLVEDMSDGTLALDLQNRIVDLNPAAEGILGCPASKVLGEDFGRTMASLGATLGGDGGHAFLKRYEEHGQASEEMRVEGGESVRHYDLALSGLRDAEGKRTGHLMVLHEVTERRLAVERLDRLARYDTLTGLPNRAYFHERLSEEMSRARRRRSPFALLFLDLDRFKAVNDSLGHEAGDLLLQEAARRIKQGVREYDFVARLAGDEFTVILPEVAETADAASVADRIVATLAEPFDLAGKVIEVTTSIGISFFPEDGTDPATLVRNADAAMYQAKQAGKNGYALFKQPAFSGIAPRGDLEADLIRAFENNELTLFYRPEIQLDTGRVAGAEALLRWDHPERGLLGSADFMPFAEEFDLAIPIERWALREACLQMRAWQDRYPTGIPLTMSVNLCSRHFMQPGFPGEVSRILQETGIPPATLTIEIQESALGDEIPRTTAALEAVKDLGVNLAVDDFGAASTSLLQLTRSP